MGDKIKEAEKRAYSTHVTDEKCTTARSKNMNDRNHLEDLSVNGKTTLKLYLKIEW